VTEVKAEGILYLHMIVNEANTVEAVAEAEGVLGTDVHIVKMGVILHGQCLERDLEAENGGKVKMTSDTKEEEVAAEVGLEVVPPIVHRETTRDTKGNTFIITHPNSNTQVTEIMETIGTGTARAVFIF
jgi:hypothetical protein